MAEGTRMLLCTFMLAVLAFNPVGLFARHAAPSFSSVTADVPSRTILEDASEGEGGCWCIFLPSNKFKTKEVCIMCYSTPGTLLTTFLPPRYVLYASTDVLIDGSMDGQCGDHCSTTCASLCVWGASGMQERVHGRDFLETSQTSRPWYGKGEGQNVFNFSPNVQGES